MENTVEAVPELTFGQRCVNAQFNPSKFPEVDEVKAILARLIDRVEEYKPKGYVGNTFKGKAIRSLIEASSDVTRILTTSEV